MRLADYFVPTIVLLIAVAKFAWYVAVLALLVSIWRRVDRLRA